MPWYETGALCTPSSCLENYYFPGAIAPLAPGRAQGLPSFWAVLAFEVIFVGLAGPTAAALRAPRASLSADVGVYPGGRFDPFKFSEKVDMEEMKIKELKHCRLAMGAFLGRPRSRRTPASGPVANLTAHLSDPSHNFFGSQTAPGTCKHATRCGCGV